MSKLQTFIESLPTPNSFSELGVYEKSLTTINNDFIFAYHEDGQDYLVATGLLAGKFLGNLETTKKMQFVKADTNYENMNTLRSLLPFTKPIPVLREKRSFGLGDRLGLAGEGHLRVFEKYDAYPILAQQSMRELTLTNRNYSDVLDAASLAVFKFGFKRGFGADGDHLKLSKDIKYALDLGFSMITLDTSDYIRGDVASLSDSEVDKLVTLTNYHRETYLNGPIKVSSTVLEFNEIELKRAILIYQSSIDYTTSIYNEFFKDNNNADLELSIDETATPTEIIHHYFIANELKRNNVKLVTIAPRFHGEFQKGIDYIGDTELFASELVKHVDLAEHFGYKLSVHSGSDKWAIFEIVGDKTSGHFHVKTAGTNWLEAVKVVAVEDYKLYREIHEFALQSFDDATKLYHVTTNLNNVPALDTLKDEELVNLFDNNDARQLLHITYGHILTAKDDNGNLLFKDRLFNVWTKYSNTYASLLEDHIGRHLELLYKGIK